MSNDQQYAVESLTAITADRAADPGHRPTDDRDWRSQSVADLDDLLCYARARNGEPTHMDTSRIRPQQHPLCARLRQLRTNARLTLQDIERRYAIPSVVVGAYERGERLPPLPKLDRLLAIYGYRLQAVPATRDSSGITQSDLVTLLRDIADRLEQRHHDVPTMRESTPPV